MHKWNVLIDETTSVSVTADDCEYSYDAVCFYVKGAFAKDDDPATVLTAVFNLEKILGVYRTE